MALDLSALFGGAKQQRPDPRVSLALMLRHLAELLEHTEQEGEDQPIEPIPVKARVEPLGG